MRNFWTRLKKPIFALAPMEGVTDCAMREIFAKYGKPDVMFTEFVNVDGLLHPEGFKKLKVNLAYTEKQRPIVAQIWGREPGKFKQAAKVLKDMGFDGIDINMGCPKDKEIAQKTCAALILEPALAGKIVEATIQGAGGLPVSVKTRLGYSKADEMQGWLLQLLKYPLAAITVHARTKQEKSKVPAHWEKIKEAVELRDVIARSEMTKQSYQANGGLPRFARNDKTLIIGNGDIASREEGLQWIGQTGCDGVMIARAATGNPWIFGQDSHLPSIKEKLQVLLEHVLLHQKFYSGLKSFISMRKNLKAYASGFEGAHALRARLMEAENVEEVEEIIKASRF